LQVKSLGINFKTEDNAKINFSTVPNASYIFSGVVW